MVASLCNVAAVAPAAAAAARRPARACAAAACASAPRRVSRPAGAPFRPSLSLFTRRHETLTRASRRRPQRLGRARRTSARLAHLAGARRALAGAREPQPQCTRRLAAAASHGAVRRAHARRQHRQPVGPAGDGRRGLLRRPAGRAAGHGAVLRFAQNSLGGSNALGHPTATRRAAARKAPVAAWARHHAPARRDSHAIRDQRAPLCAPRVDVPSCFASRPADHSVPYRVAGAKPEEPGAGHQPRGGWHGGQRAQPFLHHRCQGACKAVAPCIAACDRRLRRSRPRDAACAACAACCRVAPPTRPPGSAAQRSWHLAQP